MRVSVGRACLESRIPSPTKGACDTLRRRGIAVACRELHARARRFDDRRAAGGRRARRADARGRVVWAPCRGELPDRERAEALLHTIMMLSAKAQAVEAYRAAGVREAEVAMAGDDCLVCDEHRHACVPLDDGAASALPPFHPGCRCGFRPHLG